MFSADRLQRLIQHSIEAEPPSEPAPAPAPAPTESTASGSSNGGRRGGRNRPQSGRPAPDASASSHDRGGASRGGRGGHRGAVTFAANGTVVRHAADGDTMNAAESASPPVASARGNRGGRGGRGGSQSKDSEHTLRDRSSEPTDASNGQRGGRKHKNGQRPASASAPRPSKEELALAAEQARAAEEAALDDPQNPLNIPSPPLVTELTQIARRYNKSFKQAQHRSTITCSFSFGPTDPDFPFALPPEKIVLQFTFADISTYPYTPLPPATPANTNRLLTLKRKVQCKVLNAEKDIPKYMREAIEASINVYIYSTELGRPQILRSTIKMLDKEISDWMQLAQKKHNALVERTVAKLTGQDSANASATAATAASAAHPTAPSVTSSAASPVSSTAASNTAPTSTSAISAASSPLPPAIFTASQQQSSASPDDFDAIPEEDVWTDTQQSALEHGLKTVPKALPTNERWDKIASFVEGKTRAQVLARFKSIRDAFKHAKPAPSTVAAAAPSSAASAAPEGVALLHYSNAREVDPDEVSAIHAERIRQQQLERQFEAQRLEEEAKEEAERKQKGHKQTKQKKADKQAASSSDEHDDEADGESGDAVFVPTTERLSLNPQHRGTQILVDDLEMTGIGIIKSQLLHAQLLCVRCETRCDIEFAPSNGVSNPASERCQRCGIHLSLVYRPEMVHEHSDSLGYLDLINGELFDLLPSDFLGTCLECFTEYPLKGIQRGLTHEGNCRSCHTKITCRIEGFGFERITPAVINYDEPGKEDTRGKKAAAAVDPRELAAAKNRRKEQLLLKLGTPLPNKGTCKHYGRSFRWMRFPCCGCAFPCDDCHNEAADHPCVWATRMICGACSKEQPFSSKPCVHCGLAFSSVAKTFWEGGSGMRDTNRLSRNDSRKHRGANKTVSMKASRVGQKGKDTNKSSKKETGNNTQ